MHSWKIKFITGLFLSLSVQSNATASLIISKDSEQGKYIDSYLQTFLNNNTKDHLELINAIPQKFNSKGEAIGSADIPALAPYFSGETEEEKKENLKKFQEAVKTGAHIEYADSLREKGRFFKIVNGEKVVVKLDNPSDSPTRAPVTYGDRAEDLVDDLPRSTRFMNTLEQMDSYKSATLEVTPWSDSYWPTYQGHLGARYGSEEFYGAYDFKKAFTLFFNMTTRGFDESYASYKQSPSRATRSAFELYMRKITVQGGENKALNTLSPAEKYDLLVGDSNMTMTTQNWENAVGTFDRYGKVESWTGLCHGWAAAAYMMDRPSKTVDVELEDGRTITFYPADIKALATSLWAEESPPSRFVGSRCNDKDPRTDPETGRIMNQKCFDNNPATWHKSVVNQIALAKRSFVMDATYDFEVWNHPVYAYDYDYFNPLTGRRVGSLEEATVDYSVEENRAKDKFRKIREQQYRGKPLPKFLVGISMSVDYVVETEPDQSVTDSSAYDASNSAVYMYDLELDSDGVILGGEWYQNAHPDFLWTPEVGGTAKTYVERFLRSSSWEGNGPLPNNWKRAAKSASRSKTPLGVIVESLIQRAQ